MWGGWRRRTACDKYSRASETLIRRWGSSVGGKEWKSFLELVSNRFAWNQRRMSCNVIREALVSCLLKSDCVLRSDPPKSPADCIKEVDSLPEECVHLRKAFFECKRGMVSPRSPASWPPSIRSIYQLSQYHSST